MKASILALFMVSALSPQLAFSDPGHGQVMGIVPSNGHVRLSFATSAGIPYQPQRNDDLGTRWWSDDGTGVTATTGQTMAECDAGLTCSFFRVLEFTNTVFWYDWAYRDQNPYLTTWGLGSVQDIYHHVDRAYEWYIDQADTGAASGNNCGPSSVTMAIKWNDGSFAGTAEDARNWSYSWRGNGWWYTSDIINYLDLHSVPNLTSAFTGANQLNALMSEGKLIILCISTAYLTQNTRAEERIGRFYSYAGGHFLVVKGSRSVSGNLLLEVYDPNNWHAAYSDGTPKGRNRHLRASELASAIQHWWNYIIVVQPAAGGGGVQLLDSTWVTPVDPMKIKHAWGR